jgi:hypothetical protein
MRPLFAISCLVILSAGAANAEPLAKVRPAPARVQLLAERVAHDPPAASAPSLSKDERRALLAGEIVQRPMELKREGGRYVGGVAYQIVHARADQVLAALQQVENLPLALPRTKRARLIDMSNGRARIELVQGNSIVEARYTVHLEPNPSGQVLRFWLDRSRPHDIDDVWGFFRVEQFDKSRSVVSVAVALDMGPGIGRMLFERKIQALVLSTPWHIREFVEPRALAQAR